MADLKIGSYNVRGLGSPSKRGKLWLEMKRSGAHVFFLQETHFGADSVPRLPTHLYRSWFLSNSPRPKSGGVAIAIHKNCPFVLTDQLIDPHGRYVFVKGSIYSRRFTFAAVYAPNNKQLTFIDSILDTLTSFKEGQLIMGGDFNVSPDPQIDTSSSRSAHSFAFLKHFRKSLQAHHLVDCWRLLHPVDRDYSYFSATHNVYTRIDLLLMDQYSLDSLSGASIGSITLSDHAPVFISLRPLSAEARTWSWRLNECILDDAVAHKQVLDAISLYFDENTTGEVGMGSVWEGHKAVIRGELISQGSRLKRAREGELQDLLGKIQKTELIHKRHITPTVTSELQALRQDLSRLLDARIRARMRHVAHKFYEFGNKCGRLLARALRPQRASGHVHKLTSTTGTPVVHSSKIAHAFKEYYARLYHLPSTVSGLTDTQQTDRIAQYLTEAQCPQLAASISKQLDVPISLLEIKTVIKDLPNGKSPGPDGYTNAYYKKYSEVLTEPMCAYFTALASGTVMPKEALMAHITVLPKEGKDHSMPGSYRPISLLNTDIKILAKILANRLKPILPSLIHPDQTGFIMGREARDNSNRALQLIHWAESWNTTHPRLLLSTDAEKAFDRVDWTYMRAVLTRLGLGPSMLSWISSLYSSPTARVKVNGLLSDAFPIHNGTRQGCPLSPLIFALTLEPLLNKIRLNRDIRGFTVGPTEHKLSAYADDVLFYVSEPLMSLPNIIAELKEFHLLSNFKINYNKSEILSLNIPMALRTQLQTAFSFTWCQTSLKYLGIYLPTQCSQLYTCNYSLLLTNIRTDLKSWNRAAFSWMGRVSILKMNVLPRILFFLQMVPIALPRTFFSTLNSLFIQYIWSGKGPRLALRTIQRPKARGGMGVPMIRKYYEAIALQRILDWYHNVSLKLWVPLDKFLAGRNLSHAPWVPRENRGLSMLISPMASHTLNVWDALNGKGKLAPAISPLAPLGGFPWFTPGEHPSFFRTWTADGEIRCGRFVQDQGLIPLAKLRELFGPFPMDEWRYRQLKHFIDSLPQGVRSPTVASPFERLCMSSSITPHAISVLYELLQSSQEEEKLGFIREWERDLNHTFTESQLEHLFRLTHTSTVDTKMQENSYKVLTRWYRVPTKLTKIYPSLSAACWRECGLRGSFLHIWWECPKLRPFWLDIHTQIKLILDVELPDSPLESLLHFPTIPLGQYRKSILPHLLNAARRLIPIHWKKPQIPTRAEWIGLVDNIMAAEEWMAKCKDKYEKFYSIWATWMHYTGQGKVPASGSSQIQNPN